MILCDVIVQINLLCFQTVFNKKNKFHFNEHDIYFLSLSKGKLYISFVVLPFMKFTFFTLLDEINVKVNSKYLNILYRHLNKDMLLNLFSFFLNQSNETVLLITQNIY